MNPGKYNLKEFLTHHNLEQIIIPEIQRDYVWGVENVRRLLESLDDDAAKVREISDKELSSLSPEIKRLTLEALKNERPRTNIGFIYAYHNSDYRNKYFLIDGQQRLTTIYLMLLALSIKENNTVNFINSYFFDGKPKIDYKVRQSSQTFLRNFTKEILDGTTVDEIPLRYWYYTDYHTDKTINSIIENYQFICSFLQEEHCKLTFDYIEKNVEFWYFDTDKSEQGEELYIYMNSRGESTQANENIKANLLEGLSEDDKEKWGKRWEEWQDFFWKNRSINENADDGINEFLKWIKLINYTLNNNDTSNWEREEYINNVIESDNINQENLSFQDIDDYFNAFVSLKRLNLNHFREKWLRGETELADYIRLLPLLMYLKKHLGNNNIEERYIERFARFFYNLPRIENIGKNPQAYIILAITITNDFLNTENNIDIADILLIKEDNDDYKKLLTKEECFKLAIYKYHSNREEVENEFWKAEDYRWFNGKIEFLFKCIDINIEDDTIEKFEFSKFKSILDSIYELFGYEFSPDDIVRRAILTKGNYLIWDGNTPKLGGQRWTFNRTMEHWRELLSDIEKRKIIKSFILEYETLIGERKEKMTYFIKNFEFDKENWLSYFIKDERFLEYCSDKNICFINNSVEGIYLLSETRALEGCFVNMKDFIENLDEVKKV